MTGTLVNIIAVLVGGTIGLLFGVRLPERVRHTVVAGLGLFTAAFGIQMAVSMKQPLIVLGSLLIGSIIGEWWRLEDRLGSIGSSLEKMLTRNTSTEVQTEGSVPYSSAQVRDSQFIRGFLTASLVFVIGPMTILGAIQDGLSGDFSILAVKSVLDGFASLAFASTMGIGVLFSSLVILVYQGGLSLVASQANAMISAEMMNEMTATGGILLVGIAVSSLLEIKHIRVASFLPALVLAPLIVGLLSAMGIL